MECPKMNGLCGLGLRIFYRAQSHGELYKGLLRHLIKHRICWGYVENVF